MANRMSRIVSKVNFLPKVLSGRALTVVMGHMVPFIHTAGLRVDELTEERAVIRVLNVQKVQNHIGGVHAAAMALLAETATGFVVGMNVPDTAIPLIRSMKVSYVRRTKGAMRAEATLSDDQRARILQDPKGDVTVAVAVTDETGEEPIRCEMVWAWIPKRS